MCWREESILKSENLLAVYAKARSMVNVYTNKTRDTPGDFIISVVVIVLGDEPFASPLGVFLSVCEGAMISLS